MDLGLKDKIALVTGSTMGIGLSIAKSLAEEGAIVYVNGRSADKVQKIIANSKESNLRPAAFDLSDEKGVDALIQAIPHLDILVNNMGIYEEKPFAEISDEEWLHIFNVNVLSGVRLCRHYLPLMLKQNWGRIVFISSESAVNVPVEMIHYGMTKTAQLAVARGLAEMTKGSLVTVNSVLPGPTLTEGVKQFVEEMALSKKMTVEEEEKDFFTTDRPSSLLQRFASVDEVGSFVTFVCSQRASAINGAALRVEGGVVRSVF